MIDTTSAIEIRNGRRVHSLLTAEGNQLVGRIDAWLSTHPGTHSPSQIARGTGTNAIDARTVLQYLDEREMFVIGDGNGNWRRYGARRGVVTSVTPRAPEGRKPWDHLGVGSRATRF
ncbi:hypothetical protein SEA_OSCAR_79 [Mycobacterium phage Oscar]|nr:hypothetical protein SEA_OSCAR_79 [Mycobacterium phage Oscar]